MKCHLKHHAGNHSVYNTTMDTTENKPVKKNKMFTLWFRDTVMVKNIVTPAFCQIMHHFIIKKTGALINKFTVQNMGHEILTYKV